MSAMPQESHGEPRFEDLWENPQMGRLFAVFRGHTADPEWDRKVSVLRRMWPELHDAVLALYGGEFGKGLPVEGFDDFIHWVRGGCFEGDTGREPGGSRR